MSYSSVCSSLQECGDHLRVLVVRGGDHQHGHTVLILSGITRPGLGRPVDKSKLDTHEKDIREMLARGATQRFTAKSVGCTESTLSVWLTRKRINPLHLREQVITLVSQK
jgi:hypothetical protein